MKCFMSQTLLLGFHEKTGGNSVTFQKSQISGIVVHECTSITGWENCGFPIVMELQNQV